MPDPALTDLRYDAGAPWLDLLGTHGYPFGDAPVERLADRARLTAFLDAVGLAPSRAVTDADLVAARSLREALRGVALAVVEERAPEREALAAVAAAAERDAGPLELTRTPRLARRAPRDASEALGRLARAALEDLSGPGAADVRACAEPDCRKLFRDASGRRRWCAPQTCGNRARVRALRERRRAAGEI
jgi:predicted RNA-binding Zn ribbon-like protein